MYLHRTKVVLFQFLRDLLWFCCLLVLFVLFVSFIYLFLKFYFVMFFGFFVLNLVCGVFLFVYFFGGCGVDGVRIM